MRESDRDSECSDIIGIDGVSMCVWKVMSEREYSESGNNGKRVSVYKNTVNMPIQLQ